jgi:hypothetical protein
MSGIENPLLLETAIQEGTSYGVIQKFIQTNEPSPGFANVPIYYGTDVVGYYSVYPINIPANYVTSGNDLNPNPSGPENYNVAKGYILIAQVLSVPSGSPGINVTPMPLPEPFMTGPWIGFETNDQGFNFDAIADNQVQFQMPSSAPAVNGLIVIGF